MSRLLGLSLVLTVLGLTAALCGPRGLDLLPLPVALATEGPIPELGGSAPVLARLTSPWMLLVLASLAAILEATCRALAADLSSRRFLVAVGMAAVVLSLASSELRGGFRMAHAVHYQGYLSDLALFDGPRDVLASQAEHHDEHLPHTRTHPPGPLLLAAGLAALARGAATLVPGDGGFSSGAVLEVFLVGNLGGLLVVALAWLWLLPLFHLVRRLVPEEPRAPVLAVAFGAAVAGLHGVAPLFDALHPLLVTTAALGLAARSRAAALGAGLVAGVALVLAYGNLVAGPCLLAIALGASGEPRGERVLRLGSAAAGVALVLGALALLGFDYAAGFRRAMTFHEAGVNQYRARGLFALTSPWTFALWVGLPVVLGAVRALGKAGPLRPLGVALAATLLLLVASGTTRGETERLWLGLMPFVVVLSVGGWLAVERPRREPLAALALALVGVPVLVATTRLYS